MDLLLPVGSMCLASEFRHILARRFLNLGVKALIHPRTPIPQSLVYTRSPGSKPVHLNVSMLSWVHPVTTPTALFPANTESKYTRSPL